MNDYNAFPLAVIDMAELTHFPVIDDIPLIASIGINTAEHIHQRGLPCTIFPYQGMDFPLVHPQVHIIKSLHARKYLGDIFHFQ